MVDGARKAISDNMVNRARKGIWGNIFYHFSYITQPIYYVTVL